MKGNYSIIGKPGSPLILLVKGMWRHRTSEELPRARPGDSTKGQPTGEHGPSHAGRSHCRAVHPDSQPLLWDRHPLLWVPSEGRLRGTAGPLRLQRPNGMQIGICSLKDVLCMDFLLDFTWKLIIHHRSRACTKSGLCQQFLVSWDLMPNSSPLQGGLGDTKGLERGRGGSRNHFRASSEAVWSWLGGGGAKMGRRGLTRRSRSWSGSTKDAKMPRRPVDPDDETEREAWAGRGRGSEGFVRGPRLQSFTQGGEKNS